jgi:hypothetical protein
MADRVFEAVAKQKVNEPIFFAVQSYEKIAEGLYSVICNVVSSDILEADMKEAVAAASNGKARMVDGTLHMQNVNSYKPIARMIVAANIESFPFSDEIIKEKGMVAITANTLLDSADGIWKIEGDGDAKRVVQTTKDSIEEILQARRSSVAYLSNPVHASSFENGDFVSFATTAGEIHYGFAMMVEGIPTVIDTVDAEAKEIKASQIINVAMVSDKDYSLALDGITLANLSKSGASKQIEYARKLYGNHPAFFNRLVELINAKAGKHQPVFTRPMMNTKLAGEAAK